MTEIPLSSDAFNSNVLDLYNSGPYKALATATIHRIHEKWLHGNLYGSMYLI